MLSEAYVCLGLTKRMCSYYKDTGIIFKGFLFISNKKFISILPEAIIPGAVTLKLTQAQINTLVSSFSKT